MNGSARRARRGPLDACTRTEVLQEILYRYSALGRRDLAREVYDLFVEVFPVILGVTIADTDGARDLLTRVTASRRAMRSTPGVMLNHGIEQIAKYDAGYDQVNGIRRANQTSAKLQ